MYILRAIVVPWIRTWSGSHTWNHNFLLVRILFEENVDLTLCVLQSEDSALVYSFSFWEHLLLIYVLRNHLLVSVTDSVIRWHVRIIVRVFDSTNLVPNNDTFSSIRPLLFNNTVTELFDILFELHWYRLYLNSYTVLVTQTFST